MRDRNRKAIALGLFVRPGEDVEVARPGAVPVRFHGGDLDRLIFERVQAVLVADQQLQRRQHRHQSDRHAQHRARFVHMAPRDQVARADREHDKARGQVRGVQHVGEPIEEARIEHDRKPVPRIGHAVSHLVAGRRVHPAIGRENPERRQRGAERHHHRRQHVQPARHPPAAEQHDREEGRLQEKGAQHFVAGQRPDDIAGDGREPAPIGAELVGQHDPRDHAHAEGNRENLGPELRDPPVVVVAGDQCHGAQRGDIGRQADREAREDDVE